MKKISLSSLLFISALLWIVSVAKAQEPGTPVEAIEKTVSRYLSENGFAGTILVAERGVPLFQRSSGLAYRAAMDTLQNDYRFGIASITKMFTSIRVLQLAEQGKIDLHQSIGGYLPELAAHIHGEVSPHHLLLHLSGLPNLKDKLFDSPRSAMEMVKEAFTYSPNSQFNSFNYNNLDYLLLGLLIEEISGNAWEDEIKAHILEPLHMKNTGFLEYGYYPDRFAYTYSYRGKKKPRQDPLYYIENAFAAGCMYSTALDLLALDQGLYNGSLLGDNGLSLLEKSYPEYGYVGYGVWNYTYPFVDSQPRIMERRGGILGANVVLVRLTESRRTIIILSNDDRFNPDSFGDESNLRERLIRVLSQMAND